MDVSLPLELTLLMAAGLAISRRPVAPSALPDFIARSLPQIPLLR